MLDGKKIEVILPTELEVLANQEKMGREQFLEKILNEYADAGYRIAGVWKDSIIMENFKPPKKKPIKKEKK